MIVDFCTPTPDALDSLGTDGLLCWARGCANTPGAVRGNPTLDYVDWRRSGALGRALHNGTLATRIGDRTLLAGKPCIGANQVVIYGADPVADCGEASDPVQHHDRPVETLIALCGDIMQGLRLKTCAVDLPWDLTHEVGARSDSVSSTHPWNSADPWNRVDGRVLGELVLQAHDAWTPFLTHLTLIAPPHVTPLLEPPIKQISARNRHDRAGGIRV